MQNNSSDKIIISDAACIIGLTNIGRLDLLKKLFDEVIITPEVKSEYKLSLPEWIIIMSSKNRALVDEYIGNGFGKGESSSIALAAEITNSALVLDDDRARKFARSKGFNVIGTLTILAGAYDKGYIESYEVVCEDLKKANFRFTQKIQDDALNSISADNKKMSPEKQTPKKKGFRR